ncbi:hypothetical protein [Streptomyces sp. NPDC090131]|uniref:hypothetical protein n=1 Tax=Streptomyces sp. NPDC090131 TaxID=3365954 RepID=UPI0038146033
MSTPSTGKLSVHMEGPDTDTHAAIKSVTVAAFKELDDCGEIKNVVPPVADGPMTSAWFCVDVQQPGIGGGPPSPLPPTGTARVVLRGDADDREQVFTLLESTLRCTREETYRDDETVLHIDLSQTA